MGRIVRDVGETEIEKFPCGGGACACTTSVPEAVCVVVPLVPVIVNGYVPGVTPVVPTVSTDDPAPVTEAGANTAFGSPVAEKLTALEKPPVVPTVTL